MATYSFVANSLKLPRINSVAEYKDGVDEIAFNHGGNMGDIFYSLYFVTEFLNAKNIKTVNFNIRINQYVQYPDGHPNGNVLMSERAAEFAKPLLETLGIFQKVSVAPELPENVFDLDKFRKLPLNVNGGDIRSWYYNLCEDHLPQDFEKPLFAPEHDDSLKDKVILIFTARYRNIFAEYEFMKKYRDDLVFLGLPEEHNNFCERYFEVDFFQVKNAKQTAELMSGARGVIGNPSGLYSIAECLKIPRVLLTPEYMSYSNGQVIQGPVNVHPRGGWFEVAQTAEKFKYAVGNLLKK